MAVLSGAATNAILQIASTWGTAVDGGAGDKFAGEITPNFNVEELIRRQIGSGVQMTQSAVVGNFKPTINLTMDAGYRNTMDVLIAQFMGTAGAPSEVTGGQGDYLHSITFNNSLNAKYVTLAYETSSTTVMEFPTCAVRSISFAADDPPGILEFSAELLANTAVTSGTTNTNADLQSATATDTEVIAYAVEDTFRMNANSGGALSGSDQYNITSFNLTLTRPQEIFGEIKGSSGNSAPLATGLFEGELTITASSLADHAKFTEWGASTAQKCTLNIQGTQIGTGTNKAITILIPKMVLVTEPQYNIVSEGVNPLSLTYRIIAATSNPTGMGATLPHFNITNGLSTSLLA